MIPGMTAEHLADLLDKFRAEREALIASARSLDEQAAEFRRPEKTGEEGWSAKEQLAHVAVSEALYRTVVQRALAEDNPDVSIEWEPNRHDAAVRFPVARAHEATVADLLAEAAAQRDVTLKLLEDLSPADLERVATTRFFGTLNLPQWIRSLYRHDRMHAAQVVGREPDYQPRTVAQREG